MFVKGYPRVRRESPDTYAPNRSWNIPARLRWLARALPVRVRHWGLTPHVVLGCVYDAIFN